MYACHTAHGDEICWTKRGNTPCHNETKLWMHPHYHRADHAGVGNYYEPFAAHEIFAKYDDLLIEPIFFPPFFYAKYLRVPIAYSTNGFL